MPSQSGHGNYIVSFATKESVSRYTKDLEKRAYIKGIKDEDDKRGLKVISTLSELEEAVSLSERLKKLVAPMKIRELPNMAYLENRNFMAFRNGQRLVTSHPEIIDNKKLNIQNPLKWLAPHSSTPGITLLLTTLLLLILII